MHEICEEHIMYEQEIKSWDEFDNIVKPRNYRKWIYRGQPDASWELESSLFRAFQTAEIIHSLAQPGYSKKFDRTKHERVMIDKFKRNAHLYLSHLPNEKDKLSWVSLMQHYGAPTRFLDFTYSPYVAAFFCLEKGEGDSAIYSLNHDAITQSKRNNKNNPKDNAFQWFLNKGTLKEATFHTFEPSYSNDRLLAQQGLFVMPNFIHTSHEDILNDYKLSSNDLTKYIIPRKLRKDGVRHLSQMNITSTIMYPGLEGFCKSMLHQPIFDVNLQCAVE